MTCLLIPLEWLFSCSNSTERPESYFLIQITLRLIMCSTEGYIPVYVIWLGDENYRIQPDSDSMMRGPGGLIQCDGTVCFGGTR